MMPSSSRPHEITRVLGETSETVIDNCSKQSEEEEDGHITREKKRKNEDRNAVEEEEYVAVKKGRTSVSPERLSSPSKNAVYYVSSLAVRKISDMLHAHRGRASAVHALIEACGLLKGANIVEPKPASFEDLCRFHDPMYVSAILQTNGKDEDEILSMKALERYGLVDDCYAFPHLFAYCSAIAGASITAAKILCEQKKGVAVCWTGGRHHAHRRKAAGFCYVNDCVLAILEMKSAFRKILYCDLDIHHGDGVESAFKFSDRVFTLSFHSYGNSFFPCTGDLSDAGAGRGKLHCMNVPLRPGIGDDAFVRLFDDLFGKVVRFFEPDAIVLVCGADSLSRDPLGNFNLTSDGPRRATKTALATNVPTLLMGGGGYNIPDVARCWTAITAESMGKTIPEDVPIHENFPLYGPDFRMTSGASSARNDMNDADYIGRMRDALHHRTARKAP